MKNNENLLETGRGGFALIVTLSLMILLTVIAVGLLSLSAISLRSSSQGIAQSEAKANARLALMIALGELQKEMGPDMRVSTEASIFDAQPNTTQIDDVAQPRWLASYDAWGNWLNADYTPPGKNLLPSIRATYERNRASMFRRWLLSMPQGSDKDANAAGSLSGWNNQNSVVLVGKGSLGELPPARANEETRAYLTKVGQKGALAWWVSGDNQKAKINLAKRPRNLAAAAWESSQGGTAEVAVGKLSGFDALENEQANLGAKLITQASLVPAAVQDDKAKEHYFDLTANSRGVLASVRSGNLKKDLSLLFELAPNKLPAPYAYNAGASQEPSIRPMSPDLLAQNPKITARHFQSWTNMRHFHRMYRRDVGTTKVTPTPDSLAWDRSLPHSGAQFPVIRQSGSIPWKGDNGYMRTPILAKLTFIYSLLAERFAPTSTTDLRYRLFLVYTPVFTYWNPYNTELRLPDGAFGGLSATYKIFPMWSRFYTKDAVAVINKNFDSSNASSFLSSGNGGEVVFAPGEFRIFSDNGIGDKSGDQNLVPGFRPSSYGGDKVEFLPPRDRDANPGIALLFGHSAGSGNINFGNTPGSFTLSNYWKPGGSDAHWIPIMYQNDWFNLDQTYTPVTPDPNPEPNPRILTSFAVGTPAQFRDNILKWNFDSSPTPVAYTQLVLKGLSEFDHESIPTWKKDWRCRNWLHAPPSYFGSGMFISEDLTTAHTQRLDSPYVLNFGRMTGMGDMGKVVQNLGNRSLLGSGMNPQERVSSVPAIELPTAPAGSLAAYSTMRINPGWADPIAMNNQLKLGSSGHAQISQASLYYAMTKTIPYQSGVTGPGIGNSFIHPMIPRTGIYKNFNNSVSMDPMDRNQPFNIGNNGKGNDHKVFSDYWDHAFLLNDALWDDYFVSSLSDQSRPSESGAASLAKNLDRLVAGEELSNSRLTYEPGGKTAAEVKTNLQADQGYLSAARHLMVDGMFNVNSTSTDAWYSLFAGIRERSVIYREANGTLRPVSVPADKQIALSRFGTETSDKETEDPTVGVAMPDGSTRWAGVRFLDDDQLRKLAEECVKQVKRRGPFLNFSEFINRRLDDDDLGLKGALQAAIDYDDASPDSKSINWRFKNDPDFMMKATDLGTSHAFTTPEAAEGSRFAGIPGYLIQSDLLRPIANTLSVRDDTFRIRAYGEAKDGGGKVIARAWCEATVQRMPEYTDPTNDPTISARTLGADGAFSNNSALTATNLRFGRSFRIENFRWLHSSEI